MEHGWFTPSIISRRTGVSKGNAGAGFGILPAWGMAINLF
jgi:hypothetical protein